DYKVTGVQTCALPISVQDVEAGVGEVVEASIDLGVVVIQLDPIFGERVADALEIWMRELHVVFFVDEADDVVEDEDSFDCVAERSEERRVGKECRCEW